MVLRINIRSNRVINMRNNINRYNMLIQIVVDNGLTTFPTIYTKSFYDMESFFFTKGLHDVRSFLFLFLFNRVFKRKKCLYINYTHKV